MTLTRPAGVQGYYADLADSGCPAVRHAGDQRTRHYLIGEHQHPVWELYLQLAGPPMPWRVGARRLVVGPLDLLAVPPRTPHQMLQPASAAVHFVFAAIDVDLLLTGRQELRRIWHAAGATCRPDAGALIPPFEAFLREVSVAQRWRPLGVELAATLLILQATRLLVADAPRSLALSPAVAQAQRLLLADQRGELTLTSLAAAVSLSPGHLARRFAEQLGIGPIGYARALRLERAAELLADTDLPVTGIAAELGFSSPQHFATAFRAHTGRSPSAYRRRAQPG